MAKIEIELLRVSNDSKYIEFKVNCPDNYKFTGLFIRLIVSMILNPSITEPPLEFM